MDSTIIRLAILITLITISFCSSVSGQDSLEVNIQVDVSSGLGPVNHIWRYFGTDEANCAYLNNGKKLPGYLGSLRPVEVFFRAQAEIKRDGFKKDNSISVNNELKSINFILGNRYGESHKTRISVENYQGLIPELEIDRKKTTMNEVIDGNSIADTMDSGDNTMVSLGFKK